MQAFIASERQLTLFCTGYCCLQTNSLYDVLTNSHTACWLHHPVKYYRRGSAWGHSTHKVYCMSVKYYRRGSSWGHSAHKVYCMSVKYYRRGSAWGHSAHKVYCMSVKYYRRGSAWGHNAHKVYCMPAKKQSKAQTHQLSAACHFYSRFSMPF